MVQWDQWRLCSARMQAQWVKGSDMFIATARIQTLAQECPYATRAAIKKKKKKNQDALPGKKGVGGLGKSVYRMNSYSASSFPSLFVQRTLFKKMNIY